LNPIYQITHGYSFALDRWFTNALEWLPATASDAASLALFTKFIEKFGTSFIVDSTSGGAHAS
jgi:hypothetical protein